MKLKLTLAITGALAFSALAEEKAEEKIEMGGSFRYRHEAIMQDGKEDRNRERIQGKLSIQGKVSDKVSVEIGLATGSSDPVSTNQTLDGAFTTKGIGLDKANFTYNPKTVKGLFLKAGKMKNPFAYVQKSELVFDGDLTPEGVALGYHSKKEEGLAPFATVGGFWIDERSGGDDALMYGGQLGGKMMLGSGAHVKLGGGIHHYTELLENGTLYDDDLFGNSGDDSIGFSEEYTPFDIMLEAGIKAGSLPLALFGHFVQNTAVDSDNMGYLAGVAIGKAKKLYSFSLRAYYRVMEKDAVLGTFADSDFGGGGTDNNGVEINGSFVVLDGVKLGLSYFNNEKGIDSDVNYQRFQGDLKMKF